MRLKVTLTISTSSTGASVTEKLVDPLPLLPDEPPQELNSAVLPITSASAFIVKFGVLDMMFASYYYSVLEAYVLGE